ncbi:hypothetical protein BpHYR1_048360 [Brachionus plicatilis]|uniref:Uncharacterized protein n=1 Tax=Brachionus plicatilis TaxID=10195 RepID=A0A3M7QK70_BRAPC|nr:hypothetical protein BpHYR1_048360 [Brachionus plicatilis]
MTLLLDFSFKVFSIILTKKAELKKPILRTKKAGLLLKVFKVYHKWVHLVYFIKKHCEYELVLDSIKFKLLFTKSIVLSKNRGFS